MFSFIEKIKRGISVYFPSKRNIGKAAPNCVIEFPTYISCPKDVIMEPDTRIRKGTKIQNARGNTITIKRYTVLGINTIIVTNNHKCTVGVPQILLGVSRINDTNHNTIIGEDVWVGTNVTILCVDSIGRGSIIGACSTVTKDVPPYALVVGSPAKIVGVKFTIDQIIEHEKILYPESERYSREYLEELFEKYYQDKKVYGVRTEFNGEELNRLKTGIAKRKFTMPDYLEKIQYLCKK